MLQELKRLLQNEKSILIQAVWDAPKAVIALACRNLGKDILVISEPRESNRLADDLRYFSPDLLQFPAQELIPSPDLTGRRSEILQKLTQKRKPAIVIASLQALLFKLARPEKLKKSCISWKVGSDVVFHLISETLIQLGYRQRPIATDKGEFAVRGGIVDIFPVAAYTPYRIDFFGDAIEKIRTYDPIAQVSTGFAEELFLSPVEESSGDASLLDYLSEECTIIFDDLPTLEDRYTELKELTQLSHHFSFEQFFALARKKQCLFFTDEHLQKLTEVKQKDNALLFSFFSLDIQAKEWRHPFVSIYNAFLVNSADELLSLLRRNTEIKIDCIVTSDLEEKRYREALPHATMKRGYLSSGFLMGKELLLPSSELTGRYKVTQEKWRTGYASTAAHYDPLAPGDLAVHFHQGICKYLGLEKQRNHLGEETEFLLLEFAEGSKLYVPISQSHLVSRYIGPKDEMPTFHTIGSSKWIRTRAQAEKAIIGYAEDLLKIHAERSIHGGFTYPEDGADTIAFEEEFPFIATEDQIRAISAVKQEMTSSKAMDRLICGDVGYGKTEVAMRAAFKVVSDGKKQVALLVPTTVLALQHYETLCERMANFPIRIGIISRFQSALENRKTIEKTFLGEIDILIGTHRLLSKDVLFHDLGLLIIDEEQRFGVRAKEHLKALKVGVESLSLSATPIPRTLYLSLIGAREISLLNTPPQNRLPIKTLLIERRSDLIRRAVLQELSRNGQVYFIHNRVESIFNATAELQKLVPEARIVTGHGQMDAEELETVIRAFKEGKADILVATTIVENGIDIPNANTILIDRADQFGLADLYQLRGRVGRSSRSSYAYLLIPAQTKIPELAYKRLQALLEASGYGGGLKIAMRDLEIRGAGNILGTEQSGQIAAIGFHLYCKLLKKTVNALKSKKKPSFRETKIEFYWDARLPEDYVNDVSLRLELYQRLGDADSLEEIESLFLELEDRFGKMPQPALNLLSISRIRLLASQKGIDLLKCDKRSILIEKKGAKQNYPIPYPSQPTKLEANIIALLEKII